MFWMELVEPQEVEEEADDSTGIFRYAGHRGRGGERGIRAYLADERQADEKQPH